jgi:hypothetical protein
VKRNALGVMLTAAFSGVTGLGLGSNSRGLSGGDMGGVEDPGPSSVPELGRVWAQANVVQAAVATSTHVLINSELAE